MLDLTGAGTTFGTGGFAAHGEQDDKDSETNFMTAVCKNGSQSFHALANPIVGFLRERQSHVFCPCHPQKMEAGDERHAVCTAFSTRVVVSIASFSVRMKGPPLADVHRARPAKWRSSAST